ncbi:DUF2017 domain-containing protein [Streptomyces bohaiensis]|uniref:DUF2017 domain-containing protein n=1 Tax=Streptomyces bohaiensis TaxID=1431344 RepID=A0ABX1C9B2_9ACTN|nr:DUF2017 domain-containing protein [Streptomyces bohaiensis]NJQ15736.1 DUF2017 domain-containing protein [Streptomyces bohaiensis]
MSGYFKPAADGAGASISLDAAEISILRSLTAQLLELIGPGPGEGDAAADPLDALFAEGPSEPPADPVLARLFPDAYGAPGQKADEEDGRRSSEFRRYTELDLRARKREDGLAVIRDLDALDGAAPGGAELRLSPAESQRWLITLNDLRLAIGTRLEISEDDDTDRLFDLPDGDPVKPIALAYLWLGGLQETLVETL